jgi:hypothetical protein
LQLPAAATLPPQAGQALLVLARHGEALGDASQAPDTRIVQGRAG